MNKSILAKRYREWCDDTFLPMLKEGPSRMRRDLFDQKYKMADVALFQSPDKYSDYWNTNDYDKLLEMLSKEVLDSNTTLEQVMNYKDDLVDYDEQLLYEMFIKYSKVVFRWAISEEITTDQREALFKRYQNILAGLPKIKHLGREDQEDGIFWFKEVEETMAPYNKVKEKEKVKFLDEFFKTWERMSGDSVHR